MGVGRTFQHFNTVSKTVLFRTSTPIKQNSIENEESIEEQSTFLNTADSDTIPNSSENNICAPSNGLSDNDDSIDPAPGPSLGPV